MRRSMANVPIHHWADHAGEAFGCFPQVVGKILHHMALVEVTAFQRDVQIQFAGALHVTVHMVESYHGAELLRAEADLFLELAL